MTHELQNLFQKLEDQKIAPIKVWRNSDIWSRVHSWVLASDLNTVLYVEGEYKTIAVPSGTVWQSVVEFEVIKEFYLSEYYQGKYTTVLIEKGTCLKAQPSYGNKCVIAQTPHNREAAFYAPLTHIQLVGEKLFFVER